MRYDSRGRRLTSRAVTIEGTRFVIDCLFGTKFRQRKSLLKVDVARRSFFLMQNTHFLLAIVL